MPLIWIKKGDEEPYRTFYNDEGFCCLRYLGFEPFSIKLDSIMGFLDEKCVFFVPAFLKETGDERGSTADLAIVVTGKSGIHHLLKFSIWIQISMIKIPHLHALACLRDLHLHTIPRHLWCRF